MSTSVTKPSDYVIGEISPEQFISEHTILYVIKGIVSLYDGNKNYTLRSNDCFLGRKNRLASYKKEKEDGELEKVFIFFDQAFLKMFQEKYKSKATKFSSEDTFSKIKTSELVHNFFRSIFAILSWRRKNRYKFF